MNEGLDKNQKRAGQLGPTKKVGKNGPRGVLVGANESADGNTPSTKMFLEVDDDEKFLDEADLIISPALFGKGDRSFKPKHADHEVSMARNDCFQSAVNAAKVFKMLRNVSEMQGIDGWVASKITLAADYLNTVREYLEGQQLERNSMRGMTETQHHNDQPEDFLDPEDEDYDDNTVSDEEELVDISGPLADLTSEFEKYSAILDKQKNPQYEMMLPNGQARKFRANDDEDARRIAKSLGATSLIKVRNNSSDINEAQLDELKCWTGYTRVQGVPAGAPGSCKKKSKTKESVAEGTVHPGDLYNVVIEYFNGGKGYRNAMALRKKAEKGMSVNELANLLNTFVMNKWGSKLKRSDSIDAVKNIVYPQIVEQDETKGSYKRMKCPECGGAAYGDEMLAEKRDACYHKVKSRYKVWPSAYACVPEESSRALTRDGWKTVDELCIGEEIMTYSMEKDIMEFKPILNLHRYNNAPTTVVKSGNTGFMFECTPNHKWVVKMPEQKSDRASKYEKVNGMALLETSEMLEVKSNKHLVVTAPYEGGTPLKKDKMFKYGDNWAKYILDITPEQRQSWLFSAIVYDGNQIRTERVTENKNDVDDLDWMYSGNHGKQSFGFKQKDVEHRDAFLLAAFLNGGTVTWKEHNNRNIYSCYYVSNKRYKNLWNFKSIENKVTDVWCPETENNTWIMMQETDGKGIITITGNSGALVKCRKVGAKNWGNKSGK